MFCRDKRCYEIEHIEDDTQLVPNLLLERDDYSPGEILPIRRGGSGQAI
ncbi:hypothetical protein J2X69_004905 [Algoriphagus sp. 4150]|nr:hypothetical protein [Algoriphagus sp. 4150]